MTHQHNDARTGARALPDAAHSWDRRPAGVGAELVCMYAGVLVALRYHLGDRYVLFKCVVSPGPRALASATL